MGLDPRLGKEGEIPQYLIKNLEEPNQIILEFNKSLIDKSCDLIPVIKPQIAFYEKYDALKSLKAADKTSSEYKEALKNFNQIKTQRLEMEEETELFKVDVPYFIEQITIKPNNIINYNEKMLKSGGRNQFVYKTGIPAFRGIVYDKAKDMFFVINTCIGAGECVTFCYALKGRYIQYPASYDSMTRRLNYLMNHPDEYEEQMYNEIKNIAKGHDALKGFKPQVVIRWNDSGDFFSKRYVKMANRVIKRLQDEGYNVVDYAYTKVADVAAGEDIKNVSFSAGANKKQSQKAKAGNNKMSYVVPSSIFKDLKFQKYSDEEELVKRVAEFFNLNVDDVITYEEMMERRDKKVPKWYVIVTPEDGDDAAFREDVKAILLTQH